MSVEIISHNVVRETMASNSPEFVYVYIYRAFGRPFYKEYIC